MGYQQYEDECDAGIAGGCGACEKCDPEWWEELRKQEFREKIRSISFGTVPGGYKQTAGGR